MKTIGIVFNIMLNIASQPKYVKHLQKCDSDAIFGAAFGAKRLFIIISQEYLEQAKAIIGKLRRVLIPGARFAIASPEHDKQETAIHLEAGFDGTIIASGSPDQFAKTMADLVEPFGEELSRTFVQAERLLRDEDHTGAMRACDEILLPAAILDVAPVYCILAQASFALGDEKAGFQALRESLRWERSEHGQIKPVAILLYNFERKRERSGLSEEDEWEIHSLLKKLDKVNPNDPDRKFRIGLFEMKSGNKDEAQKYFANAVQIAGKQGKSQEMRIRVAGNCAEIDPEISQKYIGEAQEKGISKEDEYHFHLLAGATFRESAKYSEAIAEYEKAKSVKAGGEAFFGLALANLGLRNRAAVKQNLDEMLRVEEKEKSLFWTNDAETCRNIGILLARIDKSNRETAIRFLEMALKINSDISGVRRLLKELRQADESAN
jgi:tetratricopeptide (TPR) repeat protein